MRTLPIALLIFFLAGCAGVAKVESGERGLG